MTPTTLPAPPQPLLLERLAELRAGCPEGGACEGCRAAVAALAGEGES